jgi:hypothetical protein
MWALIAGRSGQRDTEQFVNKSTERVPIATLRGVHWHESLYVSLFWRPAGVPIGYPSIRSLLAYLRRNVSSLRYVRLALGPLATIALQAPRSHEFFGVRT